MMCKRVLIDAERASSDVFVKHAGRTGTRFCKSVARTQEHQDARRELDTRQYELSQLGFYLSQTHTVFSYVCFSTAAFSVCSCAKFKSPLKTGKMRVSMDSILF